MFAKHDCKVVLWDVNSEGNEETAEEIKKMGKTCYTYTVDLSIKDEVYKTAEKVRKAFTFLIYHLHFFPYKNTFPPFKHSMYSLYVSYTECIFVCYFYYL